MSLRAFASLALVACAVAACSSPPASDSPPPPTPDVATSRCYPNRGGPCSCTHDGECESTLLERGARCVDKMCRGAGVICTTSRCKQGYGCTGNQECESGRTCDIFGGLCTPVAQQPTCERGWAFDPVYADCAPPRSWPEATNCRQVPGGLDGCLRCDSIPWAEEKNCPTMHGRRSFFYPYEGQPYCCPHRPLSP